jgi:hypothetical protein
LPLRLPPRVEEKKRLQKGISPPVASLVHAHHDSMAWTVPPDANRAAGPSPASTSGGAGVSSSLASNMGDAVALMRELLWAFFAAYLEDATELRKQRMSTLLVQADARGLLGPGAVQPLAALHASLYTELEGDAQRFAAFYHFVFFVARERGHRNLCCATAVHGWGFVLGRGRFALLAPWCDFVSRRAGTKGISEDTWCQVRPPPHQSSIAVARSPPLSQVHLARGFFCHQRISVHPPPAPNPTYGPSPPLPFPLEKPSRCSPPAPRPTPQAHDNYFAHAAFLFPPDLLLLRPLLPSPYSFLFQSLVFVFGPHLRTTAPPPAPTRCCLNAPGVGLRARGEPGGRRAQQLRPARRGGAR